MWPEVWFKNFMFSEHVIYRNGYLNDNVVTGKFVKGLAKIKKLSADIENFVYRHIL